jgi:hypothetical protein
MSSGPWAWKPAELTRLVKALEKLGYIISESIFTKEGVRVAFVKRGDASAVTAADNYKAARGDHNVFNIEAERLRQQRKAGPA